MESRVPESAKDARALLRGGVGVRFVQGPLKGTGREVSMSFLGASAHADECRDFFQAQPRISFGSALKPDIVLVAEPLPLPLDGVLRYHPFFDAILDIEPTVEAQIKAVRSKAHRRRLRRVFRSRDWKWTVGEQPEDLVRFFNEVHRPYVEQRFGALARIDSLDVLSKRFERGGRVLTVAHKGEPVCGAVLFDGHPELSYDRNGFRLDALEKPLLLAERTAALELAVIQLAQELSAPAVDLGFCRALLDDGLFTHKRRLGCRFVPERGTGRYQLWVRPELRPEFFWGAPMVVGTCGEFDAHLGLIRSAPPMRKTLLRALLKNFALPSVKRAVVWTDAPKGDPKREAFEEALHKSLGARPVEIREAS
jgi:hypothetical protein